MKARLDQPRRAALMRSFLDRDLTSLNATLSGLPDDLSRLRIDIVNNARAAEAAPVWRFEADGLSRFRFHEKAWGQHPAEIFGRWLDALPLIAAIQAQRPIGSCVFNLGDEGHRRGLAFDGLGSMFTLVPDYCFIKTGGYIDLARVYARRAIPWADRRPVAFWRGSTTGLETDLDALPRTKLCRLALSLNEQADVGFASASQKFTGSEAHLRARGILRGFVSNEEWDTYQLHIDIDGNSCPWTGLAKFHTGSPVLKVTSPHGFRQWYYDRLVPWENFVPVRSDLADLADVVRQLLGDPRTAQRIGAAGRELVRSMACDAEIARAVPVAIGAFEA